MQQATFCQDCHTIMAQHLLSEKGVRAKTEQVVLWKLYAHLKHLKETLENQQDLSFLSERPVMAGMSPTELTNSALGSGIDRRQIARAIDCLISKQLITENKWARMKYVQLTSDGIAVWELIQSQYDNNEEE